MNWINSIPVIAIELFKLLRERLAKSKTIPKGFKDVYVSKGKTYYIPLGKEAVCKSLRVDGILICDGVLKVIKKMDGNGEIRGKGEIG